MVVEFIQLDLLVTDGFTAFQKVGRRLLLYQLMQAMAAPRLRVPSQVRFMVLLDQDSNNIALMHQRNYWSSNAAVVTNGVGGGYLIQGRAANGFKFKCIIR